ncbi:MAG TPA: T9SS type A sorting domain-containing protein [Bacteroidia bacterium]|jgi:N-acetylneuraminic acid mutarotase|nr:T9SS type A sorting domain-containing protein [Bacteroidia bacterium]
MPMLSAQNVWEQRANYTGGNYTGTCAFSIGTTGYIITGNNTAVNNYVYAWSQSLNTWAEKDTFPGGRRTGASAVSMFGKGYLVGGEHPSNCFLHPTHGGVCGGVFYNDIWRYAPDSDKWTALAAFPGTGRDYGVAVADSLDSMIYYGTGNNGSVFFLRDWWGYRISTNTWIQLDSFPFPRNNAIGFFVNGGVYVGTGDNNDGKGNATADLWKYDVNSDTWTQVSSITGNAIRREAAAFVIGNVAYVGLGAANTSTTLNDLWMYDPVKDSWTAEPNYPAGTLCSASTFTIGNTGYVGTGMYNDIYDTSAFWEFTPADSVTGINTITVSNAVNLYPNPSNGVFTIESSVVSRQSIVEIYNVLGEKVFSQYSIPNTQYSIDLSGQPSGIYFYQIISGGKTAYAGKFVIEK